MVHLNGIFVFLFTRAFQRYVARGLVPIGPKLHPLQVSLTNSPNKTSKRCVAVMAPSEIVAWECGSCTYTNEGGEPGPCIMCRTERPIRCAIVAGAPAAATARTTTVNRREQARVGQKISKTYIGAGIVPTIIHDNLATTTIHLVFFMSWTVAYAAYITVLPDRFVGHTTTLWYNIIV